MEPKYSLSVYAIVLVIAATVLCLLGVASVAIICSGAVCAVSGSFDLNYLRWRSQARRANTLRASSRDTLDRFAHAQVLCAGPLLLAVVLVLHGAVADPFRSAPLIVKVLACSVEVAATVLLVSAHVDWFWILPRVSGVVTRGPCEMVRREQWTGLTTVWLFHRLMAEVGVSAAVIGVPTYMALATSGRPEIFWLVLVGLTAPVIVYRERTVAQTAWAAGDPPGKVGEIVRLHHDVDEQNVWTWAYVTDVSVKGAKVVVLDGEPPRSGRTQFTGKADYLLVPNDTLRKARRDTETLLCSDGGEGCSCVNWYCHNNPNAHSQNLPREIGTADELFEPTGARRREPPADGHAELEKP